MKSTLLNQGECVESPNLFHGYWIAKPYMILYEHFEPLKRPTQDCIMLLNMLGIDNQVLFFDATALAEDLKMTKDELIKANQNQLLQVSNQSVPSPDPNYETMAFYFQIEEKRAKWEMDKKIST